MIERSLARARADQVWMTHAAERLAGLLKSRSTDPTCDHCPHWPAHDCHWCGKSAQPQEEDCIARLVADGRRLSAAWGRAEAAFGERR